MGQTSKETHIQDRLKYYITRQIYFITAHWQQIYIVDIKAQYYS